MSLYYKFTFDEHCQERYIRAESLERATAYFKAMRPYGEIIEIREMNEPPEKTIAFLVPDDWNEDCTVDTLLKTAATKTRADSLCNYIGNDSICINNIVKNIVDKIELRETDLIDFAFFNRRAMNTVINNGSYKFNEYNVVEHASTAYKYTVEKEIRDNIKGGLYLAALTYIKDKLNISRITESSNNELLRLCSDIDLNKNTMIDFENSIKAILK